MFRNKSKQGGGPSGADSDVVDESAQARLNARENAKLAEQKAVAQSRAKVQGSGGALGCGARLRL